MAYFIEGGVAMYFNENANGFKTVNHLNSTVFYFFFKAYTVLGQYLVLKKDEELFKEWMKDTCNASSKQSSDCFNCLNDWCEEFL